MVSASIAFLILFVGLYRTQLEEERRHASEQVNLLLQAALENAMLNRDLPGLSHIIDRLGQQEGVRRVMIVNPQGEVRFSSSPESVGHRFDASRAPGCVSCHTGGESPSGRSAFLTDERGEEVLRGVNPVRNKEPCQECHGPISDHPINGVLIVDWDASTIRSSALMTSLVLIASGMAVFVLVLGGVWWMLRRLVLNRLAVLAAASQHLSAGRFDVEVPVQGNDEIADLAKAFNRMVGTLRDRLRDIRDRETFLQSLIDAVPDGIRVIDSDYRIVKVNKAYREQLRIPPEEDVVGGACYASSHGASEPCAPTLVTCPLLVTQIEGRTIKSIHTHRRTDGSTVEAEVSAAPMMIEQENERRTYVVESIRDLASDIRFGHEQKLAAVGQLAAGVAHEIRNPLASIRLALQGILRSPDLNEDESEIGDYLRLVDGQIDKCIDVTARLLKLSGGPSDQPQLIDLNPSTMETLSLLKFHADTLDISMVTELDPVGPRLMGTEGDIRMVVLNLVQNAFHAMPSGGCLTITTQQKDNEVRLIVADTGKGIAPEHRPRIFDPFFTHRADGEGGTGLGLAICKTIIDGLGGTIQVESDPGQGARFTVTLPAVAA